MLSPISIFGLTGIVLLVLFLVALPMTEFSNKRLASGLAIVALLFLLFIVNRLG